MVDHLPQADNLAARVRHFDAHGGLARNPLDQNRFRLQAQAQVFGERRDAAVLDARFGLELEPGIPLITPDLLRKRAEEIEHRATVSCGAEELAVGRLDGPDRVACELLAFARHAQLACP